MIDVLKELEDVIIEFNQYNDENLDIDSIRIEFNKTTKLNLLNQLGIWSKVNKNNKQIMDHINSSYRNIKVTNVYRLDKYNIYYYNLPDPPKYRKAVMVIFGLKQYHKEPPPRDIINSIIGILKNISNIDVCKDLNNKPNLTNLKKHFTLNRYKLTNTYYINDTKDITKLVKKVVLYDKAEKNDLDVVMWRIETNISLSNIKDKESALWLSLNYFQYEIIKLAKV
ncbi:MAG: hypothetical protein U9R39_02070 [Campylobacterota bacterium]|nr:hypothetical protein [Campylobacterota bacterium]